jgi:hypothetical protein
MDDHRLIMKSLVDKLMVLNTEDYSVRDISALLPPAVAAQKDVFDANFVKAGENELHFTHGNYVVQILKTGAGYSVHALDSTGKGDITSLAYLKNGQRIIGTYNGLYQKEKGNWKIIEGSEGYRVKFITVDSDGFIWAASQQGIIRTNGGSEFKIYNEASGLLNEFIYGILFDDEGNAWYSSNRGLGCIQKKGAIKFFTEADGLQGDEFDTQSFWKGADGKLYFGGIKGISSFYPKHVLQPEVPGKIMLSGLEVNGSPYPDEGRVDNISEIKLPHNLNALSFSFTLTDFSDVANNVYQIKMDGFDNIWLNLKNAHTARYSLIPGPYTLHIKGSSDGSNWSEEYSLPITINPAWWQTSWFKWMGGLVTMGLMFMGMLMYNRRKTFVLQQQLHLQHEMQKERERISRDLHDNIGAYSSAMIASTEYLEQTVSGQVGKEKVFYLKENARHILSTIRETIWLLNSNNLTVSGFTEGFINYCTNILRHYEGIEIEFKEDIRQNKNLSPEVAMNLLRILQEAVQNIVKHAKASKINCFIKNHSSSS